MMSMTERGKTRMDDHDPALPTNPVISGRLVWLRPFEARDRDVYVRWRSDATAMRTAGFSGRAPLSTDEVDKLFASFAETQAKTGYQFVVCRAEDGRPVGNAMLFSLDLRAGSAGFGIFIGETELWGHGLGTDATNALVDFAFGELRLERLWLEVRQDNPAALRSYEKAGFVREGVHRHASYEQGRHRDVDVMSMLRAEWESLPRRAAPGA
jgi:RimJ/RimL family protein N-acetyltransferase